MISSIKRAHEAGSERGWALASVLWAVTMLSLMAAAAQELTLVAHRTERRAWDEAVADALFQNGLTLAVAGIAAPKLDERWAVDGRSRRVIIDGIPVTINIQNEAGLYDLNVVDGATLLAIFRIAGVESDKAMRLRDAVLDWRNPGLGDQMDNAADEAYRAAGIPYAPRHGAFQSVRELQLVMEMTPVIFRQVQSAFTVYTRHATIDPDYAPEPVLVAYYNGDRSQAQEAIARRQGGAPNPSGIIRSSPAGTLKIGASPGGKAFAISEEAAISGHRFHRNVVVEFTGAARHPIIQRAYE